jgi:hypothetical protein
VLSDSANSRILPTAWTTLYALSRIPPKVLLEHVADGTVHPRLSGKAANQLLRRGANGGRNPDGDGDRDHGGRRDQDAGRGHGDDCADDHGRGDDRNGDRRHTGDAGAADSAIGPNGPAEIARKLARLEELERATRQQANQLAGYENQVAELQAKLGPPIRAQRRLFLRALRALQKCEVPGTLPGDALLLKREAITDLVELVRSAIRDGLKPERLDLVYRPEVRGFKTEADNAAFIAEAKAFVEAVWSPEIFAHEISGHPARKPLRSRPGRGGNGIGARNVDPASEG